MNSGSVEFRSPISVTEKIETFIHLFIYLLGKYLVPLLRTSIKEREKKERRARRVKKEKEIEAQRVKPLNQTLAIDEFIGDEEQNEKQKKEKEINRE